MTGASGAGLSPVVTRLTAAPHLLDLEVAPVLRRFTASGENVVERGAEAIQCLNDFPLTRYPHGPLLARVWDMRTNVTRDARLGSAPGHSARVEAI